MKMKTTMNMVKKESLKDVNTIFNFNLFLFLVDQFYDTSPVI